MLEDDRRRVAAAICCLEEEPSSSFLLYREAVAPICTLWLLWIFCCWMLSTASNWMRWTALLYDACNEMKREVCGRWKWES